MNDAEAKKPMAEEELIDINAEEAMEEPDTDEMILALQAERDELKDKFMRALAYTEWAGQNPTDPDRGNVLSAAMDLTREAIDDMSRVRSKIGTNTSVLDATRLRHEQFQNYASEAISGLEDTDLTEAITRLTADETLLQASYLSLSRLDSISLVDFLR